MGRPDRLTCEEMFRRLDEFLDRELSEDDMRRVREHLENCARCADEYRFDEAVLRETRAKLARIQAPPDLFDNILKKLRETPDVHEE